MHLFTKNNHEAFLQSMDETVKNTDTSNKY